MNASGFAKAGWVLSGLSTGFQPKSIWEARMANYEEVMAKFREQLKGAPEPKEGDGTYVDAPDLACKRRWIYKPFKPSPYKTADEYKAEIEKHLANKKGIIIATSNSSVQQYFTSCLLKELGFRRAGQKCKMNIQHTSGTTVNPGAPDKKSHWTHIWYLLQDPPKTLEANYGPSLGGCQNTGYLIGAGYNLPDSTHEIAVAVVPTNYKLPDGWRSFYRFTDQKLVHNLDKGTNQRCPHKFLLSELIDWTPPKDNINPY